MTGGTFLDSDFSEGEERTWRMQTATTKMARDHTAASEVDPRPRALEVEGLSVKTFLIKIAYSTGALN